MELKELECALEAVLFASGDPVQESKLCAVFGVDKLMLEEAARSLADHYDHARRGIRLLRLDGRYQLCSRADYAEHVRRVLETRRPGTLSPAALEVLSIVAYKQPITKAYIEQVRGVDSTYSIAGLIEKGFIEDCGRLDAPGRPVLYRTTDVFLRTFGISSLDELPQLSAAFGEDAQQLILDLTEA